MFLCYSFSARHCGHFKGYVDYVWMTLKNCVYIGWPVFQMKYGKPKRSPINFLGVGSSFWGAKQPLTRTIQNFRDISNPSSIALIIVLWLLWFDDSLPNCYIYSEYKNLLRPFLLQNYAKSKIKSCF